VAYVFRPCVVAGQNAQTLLEEIPYFRLSEAMPDGVRRLIASFPAVKPVIPDPGTRFQLVHEDDVAQAFLAGVVGRGEPGAYNLAGRGTLTMGDLADALGWYAIPLPEPALEATAEIVTRLPLAPDSVSWIHALRRPVLMKTGRAERELGWRPKHSSRATLIETVRARRAQAAED
jgi:UDP-glucose 4-epimerase